MEAPTRILAPTLAAKSSWGDLNLARFICGALPAVASEEAFELDFEFTGTNSTIYLSGYGFTGT